MQRYRAGEDLDEYEDDLEDQYEDDEDQYEDEEDEEEEKEKPRSAEEIKYLNFREKLKAKHRSILRSENGKNGTSINHSQLSNFGKFFGPSTPVIAERVIQESKSLLETRHLAPKVSTSQNDVKKVNMPSTSTSRNGSSEKPFPRQVKSKAQIIKQNRDYSQLLSEDADISKPAKELDPRKSLAPRPGFEDARSAQVRAKKIEASHHAKKEYDGREQRKFSSGSSQAHDSRRTISEKSTSGSRANYPSSDSRRQLDLRKQPQSNRHAGSSSGNGSRLTGSSSGNGSRLTGSSSGNGSRQAGSSSGNGSRQAGSISGNGSRPTVQKTLPPKYPSSSDDRKMSVGSVEKRPFSAPVGNKASAVSKTSTLDRQRPVVKPQASSVNSHLEHKRDVHRFTDSKTSKEYVAASKSQTMRPPNRSSSNLGKGHHIKQQKPVGQLQKSYAAPSKDHKIKKRRSPEPEDFDYRSEIRNLFRYNPSRFSNYDDDDDDMCMEAGFDAIQQEEKRSARIARQEDEEEWIKIQEEERRERLQKKAKMRRMR